MVIKQRDVVWVDLPPPRGSEPAGRRPAIVLQHARFNRSGLSTVVVAAITSNLKYAGLPGNVRLRKGEGGLPRPFVVNITQISAIDRAFVRDKIGQVSADRFASIWQGICLVIEPEDRV